MTMRGPVVAGVLAAAAAAAFGLALLIFGPVYLWGASVTGHVDEVRQTEHSSKSCSPVISYEVDGKAYVFRSDVSTSPCTFEQGEAVDVYYAADNPSDAHTAGGGSGFGLLLLIGAGLAASYHAVRAHLRGRGEVDAGAEHPALAVVALAAAPMGKPMGVRGSVAWAGEALVAPLTGRRCVAFEVEVRSPVFGEEGELIHRASAYRPFTLRGEGGVMATLREGVTTDVALHADERGDTQGKPSERLTELLGKAGFSRLDASTSDNRYLWSEGIVREGDEVTVYAQLAPEPETGAGYRKGATRLSIEAPPGGKVIIATHGGGGREQATKA
jgi:hypothetical protein